MGYHVNTFGEKGVYVKEHSAVEGQEARFVSGVGDVDPGAALAAAFLAGVAFDMEDVDIRKQGSEDPIDGFYGEIFAKLADEDATDTVTAGAATPASAACDFNDVVAAVTLSARPAQGIFRLESGDFAGF